MQPIIFDFTKEPKEILFDFINRKNQIHLLPSDYVLGLPVAIDRTLTTVDVAPSCTNPQTGIVTFEYHRNDMEHFFFGVNLTFYTNDVVTVESVCHLIYDKYRVHIDPDEMLLESVTLGINEPYVVKLKAKPESLLWIGEIGVWVLPDGDISEALVEYGLSKPFNEKCINGYLYSQEYFFSDLPNDVVALLTKDKVIHTNDTETVSLLNYLTDVTGDPWNISLRKEKFNLYNATVIKHTDNLIVLQLSSHNVNVFGILLFHKEND